MARRDFGPAFVLVAQQSLFDDTRAPDGKHTLWAYCHVPNGSREDMTERIEAQIERFAPGFRELVLQRSVRGPAAIERDNPNYVGGDINGGVQDLGQLYTRPVVRLNPYATPVDGLFICSSSTPPGGGVHGLCGYYAGVKTFHPSVITKGDIFPAGMSPGQRQAKKARDHSGDTMLCGRGRHPSDFRS